MDQSISVNCCCWNKASSTHKCMMVFTFQKWLVICFILLLYSKNVIIYILEVQDIMSNTGRYSKRKIINLPKKIVSLFITKATINRELCIIESTKEQDVLYKDACAGSMSIIRTRVSYKIVQCFIYFSFSTLFELKRTR